MEEPDPLHCRLSRDSQNLGERRLGVLVCMLIVFEFLMIKMKYSATQAATVKLILVIG